jgi:hypothetical protein
VEHERFDALEPALTALQARVTDLAGETARHPAKTQLKRYTPGELAGPQRRLASVHGGIDVHGDGSTTAYVGRIRRQPLAPEPGEDGMSALRRALLKR